MNVSFIFGFLLALIISSIAYKLGSLDRSGAFAAVVVGTIIFGIGKTPWAVILLIFFITSSGLSKAFKAKKAGLDEKFSKGGRRDWAQVLGNGGLATMFAFLFGSFPTQNFLWLLFLAALAAVNADTWATEIGVLSPTAPRDILAPRKKVEKGTSGGISMVGSLGALAGSLVIAIPGAFLSPDGMGRLDVALVITLAGVVGSFADSLLGATVQAIYHCPVCDKETEKHPNHSCGALTVHRRGWRWMNNDLVNFGCSLSAAFVAFLFFLF